jgi:hypothetical protein
MGTKFRLWAVDKGSSNHKRDLVTSWGQVERGRLDLGRVGSAKAKDRTCTMKTTASPVKSVAHTSKVGGY